MANRGVIEVHIPDTMRAYDAARIFAAYLVGLEAFEKPAGASGHPPYEIHGEDNWQLDGSNDFWLTVVGGKAYLGCRYDIQAPVVEAMMVVFNWKYNRHLVHA